MYLYLSKFVSMCARDRQTDRQTDKHPFVEEPALSLGEAWGLPSTEIAGWASAGV